MASPSETPDEYTVNDFINEKARFWYGYFKRNRLVMLAFGLFFAGLGLAYAYVKKPIYTAVSTFVLDGSGSSGLGSYAGLAALAGINIDNVVGGAFSGDNIQELYQSRTMLEKTLLTKIQFSVGSEKMISRYVQILPKWKRFKKIDQLKFEKEKKNYSKLEDSVLYEIVKEVRKDLLDVGKLDKKSIISVRFRFRDEQFAYLFNKQLVDNVNQTYVSIRTSKSLQNVELLQHQVDSVKRELHSNVSQAAEETDVVPNINPYKQRLRVPVEYKSIDAQANRGIYAELVRNLELAKVGLLKETPLIQSIDEPEIPLEKEQPSKVLCTLAGFGGGLFVGLFMLFIWQLVRPSKT